jgi:hypothetical protein
MDIEVIWVRWQAKFLNFRNSSRGLLVRLPLRLDRILGNRLICPDGQLASKGPHFFRHGRACPGHDEFRDNCSIPLAPLRARLSVICLHPQFPTIDFIAAKTRIAITRGDRARAGIDQIVAADPRAEPGDATHYFVAMAAMKSPQAAVDVAVRT